MLDWFEVERFKSFRRAQLPLAEVTVLIGANASGKSNLLEGLRLLSWLARGKRLSEIAYALRAEERRLDVRGPVTRLVHDGALSFVLGTTFRDDQLGQVDLRLSLELRQDGLHIADEHARVFTGDEVLDLYEAGTPAAYAFAGGEEHRSEVLLVECFTNEGGGKSFRVPCVDQQAVFTQLTTPARLMGRGRAQELIPRVTQLLQRTLEDILFLDPIPRRMRDYSFTVERTLEGDGSNLSAVLYDLCEKQQRKTEVLEFVRALPEQDILDVAFLRGPRDEVMVQLTESFGNQARTYEAALLSDGTLRVLAVAAALLSVPEGSLVVVEEIDNGVHPTRAKLLLDNIQRLARARKLRVLLTTHNPALLDAVPVNAIPDVVACFRDPEDGDSRLMPLRNLQDYPELVAQGPVGQLVTRGILERYLKSPKGPEEKAAQAQKVLDLLQSPAGES
jgi:ABC-type cobalamin/Fe3+-siderophores transport system ATPase subunit